MKLSQQQYFYVQLTNGHFFVFVFVFFIIIILKNAQLLQIYLYLELRFPAENDKIYEVIETQFHHSIFKMQIQNSEMLRLG